jgi:hypothetical protein
MMIPRLKMFLNSQRGATLPLVLFAILFLTLLGSMALMTSTVEIRLAASERNYQQAIYVAEAGIDHFAALLKNDPNWISRVNASASVDPMLGGITAELNGYQYHAYAFDDSVLGDDDVFLRCDVTSTFGARTSVENHVTISFGSFERKAWLEVE